MNKEQIQYKYKDTTPHSVKQKNKTSSSCSKGHAG